jgi:hypothetical protein
MYLVATMMMVAAAARATSSGNSNAAALCDIAGLQMSASADGELQLLLCGDTYSVRTHFSYPMMGAGQWNSFGPPVANLTGSGGPRSWTVNTTQSGVSRTRSRL